MKKIIYPQLAQWANLCLRPAYEQEQLDSIIQDIFDNIAKNGDAAVLSYSKQFDNADIDEIAPIYPDGNRSVLPSELTAAIQLAANNIRVFHTSQKKKATVVDTMPGVRCWRESRPIERVGIYIPGGSAPLFSTVLMLAIPAQIAGCKEIILCTPPDKNGNINPAILYAASITGVSKVFAIGGAQAIGAMALGTESIPKVDKIFGPGNQYVMAAKTYAQQKGVAIDMPAGPSEVLIIADKNANPSFVAADILSQAEHGEDSQAILLSDDENIIGQTLSALSQQMETLPRKAIAAKALNASSAILLKNLEECFAFSNMYAPEHLIIATDNAEQQTNKVSNAGSVFLGNYSCESAGDYASGTNHTLPTNGYARSYSGVSVDSFVKKITFQKITEEGIKNIGPAIELMAMAEGLEAHKEAVSIRLKQLSTTNK